MKTITASFTIAGVTVETQVDTTTGTHYVTSVQINELFEIDARQDHASRTLKGILGKGSTLAKIQAEDTKVQTSAITLEQFEHLVAKLDRKGNEKAQAFRDVLVGLSLHQLSCDAHGLKFEKLERQAWLKAREQHKKQFHPLLTCWLQADGLENADYGKAINKFKAHIGLPLSFVGDYSQEHLDKLNLAEIRYDCLRNVGMAHEDAITHIR